MRALPEPVPASPMPPPSLPTTNLAPMIVFGLVFQGLAAGPYTFAAAAWMCLLPLLVLVRALPLVPAIAASFVIPLVGRGASLALVPVEAGGGFENAVGIAAATSVMLLCHRVVMRELPLVGALAAPCAVVVVEYAFGAWSLPGAMLLPLSSTQAGDVLFMRFVDVLTPLGISFGVAWGQSTMAGFGEAWIAPDPYSQAERERGLRVGANLCFWILIVLFHGGGLLRDAPTATPTHHVVVFGVCCAALVAMLASAVVTHVRRPAPTPVPAAA